MEISIRARHENGSLLVEVADTGAGLGTVTSAEAFRRGLGLSNIRDRLHQMYGADQAISISNRAGGGTEVLLRLPLRHANSPAVMTA